MLEESQERRGAFNLDLDRGQQGHFTYDPKNEMILAPQVNDTIVTDVSPLKNPSEYLPRLNVLKLQVLGLPPYSEDFVTSTSRTASVEPAITNLQLPSFRESSLPYFFRKLSQYEQHLSLNDNLFRPIVMSIET